MQDASHQSLEKQRARSHYEPLWARMQDFEKWWNGTNTLGFPLEEPASFLTSHLWQQVDTLSNSQSVHTSTSVNSKGTCHNFLASTAKQKTQTHLSKKDMAPVRRRKRNCRPTHDAQTHTHTHTHSHTRMMRCSRSRRRWTSWAWWRWGRGGRTLPGTLL